VVSSLPTILTVVNRQSPAAVRPRHCHRCTDGAPDQCDARLIPVDWPDSFAPVGRPMVLVRSSLIAQFLSREPAKPNCGAAATLSSLHRRSSRPVRCSFNTSRLARFFRARRPTCEICRPHARLPLSFLALYAHLLLRVKAALIRSTRFEIKAWVGGFTHLQLVWETVCNSCNPVFFLHKTTKV
jgi:hypothetical protein